MKLKLNEDYATMAKETGLEKMRLSGVVKGEEIPANESWFCHSELDVFFFFDMDGGLVGHSIEVGWDFL